jgi:pimeloyl-ACP methyl ester carboxylesterase
LEPPVDVVGVSTGGSIAQQLAADHPDVVRRLVLASTACRLGPLGRSLQRRVAARIRGGAPRQALAVMGAALVPPWRGQLAAAVVAFAFAPRFTRTPTDLDDMATTIEAEDDFDLAALPAIRASTLILAGGRDRFYAPALFEETARLIPGSRLRLFPRRGHITVMSDPGFRRELAAFLT